MRGLVSPRQGRAMNPRTLVVYASKHGSTREVAEAVAAVLAEHGIASDLSAAHDVVSLDGYDAVVLGAALYMGRLHADARRLLEWERSELASRTVAVFAMGPGSTDERELESSRRQLAKGLARVSELEPVSTAVFGGVFDPARLHFPFNRMPATDARDWDAIRAWAAELATALSATPVAA